MASEVASVAAACWDPMVLNFIVDRASILQEGANNSLDAFYAGRIKWRARIGHSRLMIHGTVGDGGMLVRI